VLRTNESERERGGERNWWRGGLKRGKRDPDVQHLGLDNNYSRVINT